MLLFVSPCLIKLDAKTPSIEVRKLDWVVCFFLSHRKGFSFAHTSCGIKTGIGNFQKIADLSVYSDFSGIVLQLTKMPS